MGVINITPDSFSDGGLFLDPIDALKCAENYLNNGADVLDIGAQSTRPGAIEISPEEELLRLRPALIAIRKCFPKALISVDTFLSRVAQVSLELGADWINDISGGRRDPLMYQVVGESDCPYVINHTRGNSKSMDQNNNYQNIIIDIINELDESTRAARDNGIKESNIIWDPGLGFAKNTEQCIEIIKNLDQFLAKGFPILLGPSRKRFIGDILQETEINERIWGSLAIACKCYEKNVQIIRVHDVKEVFKTLTMAKAIW